MTNETRILVVESHEERNHNLSVILRFLGESTESASSDADLKNFQKQISNDHIHAAIINKAEVDCLKLLQEWNPCLPIVLTQDENEANDSSPETEIGQVVSLIPFDPSQHQLLDALHRIQLFRKQNASPQFKNKNKASVLFKSLVGDSPGIKMVRDMMHQVADKDVTVLVTGESGTGKEVVARNLHFNSKRKHNPFVPVNCGAIPAELIESELFGHEKGAFTGAISSRAGRFEMAQGGTLFLDEIGDLPLPMQVKLLRVLQERTFERVGGTKTLTADVRIITATHRDLDKMIETGEFREDLYYRVNVFPIEMPSLRDRIDDVPLLLNELISRLENENRGTVKFNGTAVHSLSQHKWPGNIREMSNLVERLSIMYPTEVVGANELPMKYRHTDGLDQETLQRLETESSESVKIEPTETRTQAESTLNQLGLLPLNGLDLKEYLTDLEKSLITQALDDAGGVVARAAEKLHIRRTTLVEKMKKLDITK